MISQTQIDQAVKTLSQSGDLSKIILFGSYARGEATEKSDADFLVVEKSVSNPASEMVRLRRLLSPMRIPVDVVVVNEGSYNKWSTTPGNVCYEASVEGKLVYESPV